MKEKEYIAIGMGNIYLISIAQKEETYQCIGLYILGLIWYNGHHKSVQDLQLNYGKLRRNQLSLSTYFTHIV